MHDCNYKTKIKNNITLLKNDVFSSKKKKNNNISCKIYLRLNTQMNKKNNNYHKFFTECNKVIHFIILF